MFDPLARRSRGGERVLGDGGIERRKRLLNQGGNRRRSVRERNRRGGDGIRPGRDKRGICEFGSGSCDKLDRQDEQSCGEEQNRMRGAKRALKSWIQKVLFRREDEAQGNPSCERFPS